MDGRCPGPDPDRIAGQGWLPAAPTPRPPRKCGERLRAAPRWGRTVSPRLLLPRPAIDGWGPHGHTQGRAGRSGASLCRVQAPALRTGTCLHLARVGGGREGAQRGAVLAARAVLGHPLCGSPGVTPPRSAPHGAARPDRPAAEPASRRSVCCCVALCPPGVRAPCLEGGAARTFCGDVPRVHADTRGPHLFEGGRQGPAQRCGGGVAATWAAEGPVPSP